MDETNTDAQLTAAFATILHAGTSNLDDDDSQSTIDDDFDLFTVNITRANDAPAPIHIVDIDIDCQASFRKAFNFTSKQECKIYAIVNSGADSFIVGMYAFVISYTKRFARLVGYNPTSTKSARVPIVSYLRYQHS